MLEVSRILRLDGVPQLPFPFLGAIIIIARFSQQTQVKMLSMPSLSVPEERYAERLFRKRQPRHLDGPVRRARPLVERESAPAAGADLIALRVVDGRLAELDTR